jgi:hypothetical protein
LTGFDAALDLFGDSQLLDGWFRTLGTLVGDAMAAPGVAGLAARRLYERSLITAEVTAATLARALSPSNQPSAAASFLHGFFGNSAEVILHDRVLFTIVDEWLAAPEGSYFLEILPVLRRVFANFSAVERRRLLEQVGQGAEAPPPAPGAINETAFAKALPLLKLILGIDDDDSPA